MDATKPSDQALVSELAAYIREVRAFANALAAGSGFGATELTVALGATSLSIGSELLDTGFETIIVTGGGAATLVTILGGTAGQIKLFIFQDALVKLTDGNVKGATGKFYLNQLPAGGDFEPQQDDILCMVNVGGDGSADHGYWKEMYRNLSLK